MRDTFSMHVATYLDNNATTAIDPEVFEFLLEVLRSVCGNPSSQHGAGSFSAGLLRVARGQVARLLGIPSDAEIVFTSGGTESNNTAILSALETQKGRNEIVVSSIEHASVLALCAHLERSGRAVIRRLPVDGQGRVDLDASRFAIGARTAIVSVQWANNETGVLQPIPALVRTAHAAGALFHCDAVQAAGRVPIDLNLLPIDMLSVSSHKMHGPQGVGALFVRKRTLFSPLVRGGRQERGRRAGSENVAGIAAFGRAADLAAARLQVDAERMASLRDEFEKSVKSHFPNCSVLSSSAPRLPNTSCIAFADAEGDALVTLLDRRGVQVSSGAACASGSMEPSHVLRAMRVPISYRHGAVRFSFSRRSTSADVRHALCALQAAMQRLSANSNAEEAACG
jgi:cysteine desulfurase